MKRTIRNAATGQEITARGNKDKGNNAAADNSGTHGERKADRKKVEGKGSVRHDHHVRRATDLLIHKDNVLIIRRAVIVSHDRKGGKAGHAKVEMDSNLTGATSSVHPGRKVNNVHRVRHNSGAHREKIKGLRPLKDNRKAATNCSRFFKVRRALNPLNKYKLPL